MKRLILFAIVVGLCVHVGASNSFAAVTLTTLHSFSGSDGNFYGTTDAGGVSGDGTVFKLVISANYCTGDCSGDHSVTVDELLTMVNIALGNANVSTCLAGDANHDNEITVDEILTAVNNALNGCGGIAATPTPTPVPGCHSNADCPSGFPNCGPDGNCWTQPCSNVCIANQSCCGGDFPYCGPDSSCWNTPCSTLCGSTCCGPTQQCQNSTTCISSGGPTPTPVSGCHSNADCTNPTYPYCGPDGDCWTQPCSDVCSGGQSCCGGSYPYCGPDGSCWSAPCSTLCGQTCCGPSQTCQNNASCSH